MDKKQLTNEKYEELQRQKRLKRKKAREEEARLSRQLSDAYEALKEHLWRHKKTSQRITDERAVEQKIYEKLQQNLERADEAPRCAAIKADGTLCGSPKMNDHIYCFAHRQMMKGRAKTFWLPPLEDANAIQMAVMLVQRALIDDEISEKKAGLLLYSIQIAATNVHKTTFGQAQDEDMATEMGDEAEMIREHEEEMKRKTAEQGLPRMGADERGPGTEMLMAAEDVDDFDDDELDEDFEDMEVDEGPGKMLPQPVGGLEGFASLDRSTPGYAGRSR